MRFKPLNPKQQIGAFGDPKARDKALAAFKEGKVEALVSPQRDPELSIKTTRFARPPEERQPPLPSPPNVQIPGLPACYDHNGNFKNPRQQDLETAIFANDPKAAEAAIKAGADVNCDLWFNANWHSGWRQGMCEQQGKGTPLKQALTYGHTAVADAIRKLGGHA